MRGGQHHQLEPSDRFLMGAAARPSIDPGVHRVPSSEGWSPDRRRSRVVSCNVTMIFSRRAGLYAEYRLTGS
jgi:hypothetical protein